MATGEFYKSVCVTVFTSSSPARLRHEVENAAQLAGYDLVDHSFTPKFDIDKPPPQIELIGAIASSDCLVVDLTGLPQTAYYHIGMAHAAGKRLVLLAEKSQRVELPIVFKSLNVLGYKTEPNRFNVHPAQIKAAFEGPVNVPVFALSRAIEVDWDRIKEPETENLCLELLAQLGYRKVDWYKRSREIDLVAELPKRDPDGYEYKELWLVSIGLSPDRMPPEMLMDILVNEPEFFLRDRMKEHYREDEAKYSPITLLFIDLNEDRDMRRELERLGDRLRHRRRYSGFDALRIRVWDRAYLTNLVRQFPQIGYKYFSDEARSVSKYRKTPEELYHENVDFNNRLASMVKQLESERDLRARAERDAVWKDISFAAAHKIGNPIFAIETYLELLKKRVVESRITEPAQIQAIEGMDVSVERAKDVVDQFKSLTRAQVINPAPVLLRPILEDACRIARAQGVECQIQCANDILVSGDIEKLTECFEELVVNSMAWFDKPSREIYVDVIARFETSFGPTNRLVRIEWRDNGAGVEAELKERIFDAFFSRRDQGTGLGLALVRRIIEGHGGSILENGVPGFGASFMIYLPLPDYPVKEDIEQRKPKAVQRK